MKKIYLFLAIIACSCQGIKKETPKESGKIYRPAYANVWDSINVKIKSQWDNQLSKSTDLPHVYIGVFPNLPFMFYWDTYFTNKGLMIHDFDALAKNNTENLLYVVDKYGYMGNAAVTAWGMNRSQPPYLSQMVRDVYENMTEKDTAYLHRAYTILRKEYLFWTDTSSTAIEQHSTAVKGLQRFYQHAKPEEMVTLYAELSDRFHLDTGITNEDKVKISTTYAVEAATGMDFTPRFEHRCPDFIAVELNSLLYTYEINFEWMTKELQLSGQPGWAQMAEQRKNLLNTYCWNEERGLYLDYDYVQKRHSKVAAATAYQPMWAGIASAEQAKRLVDNLPLFEGPWGIATVEKCGEIKNYQWGENSIWSPMQLMVVKALDAYGYSEDAKRIATKYLDLVAKNYIAPIPASFENKSGTQTRRKGKTYEKYKIDGTINDDEYIANEMMGWSAATYAYCYKYVKK